MFFEFQFALSKDNTYMLKTNAYLFNDKGFAVNIQVFLREFRMYKAYHD